MKKLVFFLVLVIGDLFGQTPQYFNSSASGGGNSWPFNNTTTARRWQYFLPAGALGTGLGAGNNIVKIYFHCSTGGTFTYPVLNIKFKTGLASQNSTGLLAGVSGQPMEANMNTCFAGTNVQVVATAGNWFGFTLTTPWLYDPSLPLIVEIEHNSTGGGPTIDQPTTATGMIMRQYCDYQLNTINLCDGATADFGVDVVPATPCNSAPPANSLVPATASVCPGYPISSPTMATTYSLGGLTYQWYASTTSSLGPYTPVTNATLFASPLPTITANIWYQVVATCTNAGGASTTLSPMEVTVAPTTTNSVPYYEGFEGIVKNDQLPNCSWMSSNTVTCKTYTTTNTLNRVPRTGNKFASFYYTPSGASYYYSNGVYLKAGITYSAALWYTTEYMGYNNWGDLSILVGPGQNTTGLVSVASTQGPAVSNIYKSLSNTFTIPSDGMYYFAIKGTCSSASGAQYLSWDDFSVTIPCDEGSPNRPNVTISVPSTSICAGDALNLTGNGADTYTWNAGGNTAQNIVEYPMYSTNYQLVGTNALTGCSDTVNQAILVMPTPGVIVMANKYTICTGESINLTALASNVSYLWNTGSNPTSNMITVSPTVTTSYSVTVSSVSGCPNTGIVSVTVNSLPTLSVSGQYPNLCVGEIQTLTGSGAASYQWLSSSTQLIYTGSPLNVSPNVTTTYTMTGTDINGCSNKTTYTQNVDICNGIKEIATTLNGYNVYPNPTSGEFTIVSDNKSAKLIEVVDLTGRVITNSTPSSNTAKLNISNVASGVYYLKIHTENKVDVMKIVKQ